jgi:uncharacterized protein (TIGR02996 family)
MAGHIESDEAALHRAIEADPADDAPWLVYADWLQEHGRDAEAANLRRFLPDVQAAVRSGRDLWFVMAQVARLGPGAAGWGLPAPPPALPPAPRPEPGAWVPEDRPGWTPGPALIWFLGVALLGLFRAGCSADRDRYPAGGDGRMSKEAFAEIERVAKGGSEPRTGYRPTPDLDRDRKSGDIRDARWDPFEVVGQTLRLEDDSAVLAFTFAADGSVVYRVGRKGGILLPARGRWQIDERGALDITGPDGKPAYLLTKEYTDGHRYQVTRGGRSEVFVRERPAR